MKKTKFFAALLCVVICAVTITFPRLECERVTATTIAELEQKKRENEKAIKEFEKRLEEAQNSAESQERYQEILLQKIAAQEDNLNVIRTQLTDLEMQLEEANGEINELNADIQIAEHKLEQNFEYFKMRLRAMYIAGNDSVISVLAGSTDFYDMLSKVELVTRITKNDTELLESLKTQLDALDLQKKEADIKKLDIDSAIEECGKIEAEYTENYNTLIEDNKKTTDMIKMLQNEVDQYGANIEETKKEQSAIDGEIKKLEEEIRRKQEELRRKQQQQGIDYIYKGEKYLWPVPGYSYISSGYGYRWGSLHGGIDIAGGGIMGKEVVAAASGIVIMASQTCTHNYGKNRNCGCGMSYGNYIVIDHGDDADGTSYSTLYGHLTSVDVSYGQEVKAGQHIGTVGSTGYSTGAHLHFETRVNNVRKNPLNFFSKYYN